MRGGHEKHASDADESGVEVLVFVDRNKETLLTGSNVYSAVLFPASPLPSCTFHNYNDNSQW